MRSFFFNDVSQKVLIFQFGYSEHVFELLLDNLLVHSNLGEPEYNIVFDGLIIKFLDL
jgi:hypothetical protein